MAQSYQSFSISEGLKTSCKYKVDIFWSVLNADIKNGSDTFSFNNMQYKLEWSSSESNIKWFFFFKAISRASDGLKNSFLQICRTRAETRPEESRAGECFWCRNFMSDICVASLPPLSLIFLLLYTPVFANEQKCDIRITSKKPSFPMSEHRLFF